MPAISRVLVCGAGAVGSAYAARLYELDPSGIALLVDGACLERLRREGVTVNERRYDFQLRAAGEAGPRAELVLVAVKQHHLAAAIEDLRGAVGPGTIILSLLNGIVSEGMLAEAFGAEAVLHSYVVGTDFVREGTVTRYRSIGSELVQLVRRLASRLFHLAQPRRDALDAIREVMVNCLTWRERGPANRAVVGCWHRRRIRGVPPLFGLNEQSRPRVLDATPRCPRQPLPDRPTRIQPVDHLALKLQIKEG